jgi:hypothetical protein
MVAAILRMYIDMERGDSVPCIGSLQWQSRSSPEYPNAVTGCMEALGIYLKVRNKRDAYEKILICVLSYYFQAD